MDRVHVSVSLYGEVVEDFMVPVGEGIWLGDHPKSRRSFPTPPLFVHAKKGGILVGGRRLYPGQTARVSRGAVGMRIQCTPPKRKMEIRWHGVDLGFLLVLVGVSVGGMWIDMLDRVLESGQGGEALTALADVRDRLHVSRLTPEGVEEGRTAAVHPQGGMGAMPEIPPGSWAGRRAQPDDSDSGWGWYGWYRDSVPVIAEAVHAQEKLTWRPDDHELRAHVGRAAYASERYEEALFQFRWLVAQSPADARWLEGMALAEKRLGMHSQELAAYRQILERNPNHMLALGSSAVVLARLGRLAEAWEALEELRALYPAHALPLVYEGLVFAIEGKEAYALAALEEGLTRYGSLSKSLQVELHRDIALDPAFSRLRSDARLVGLVEGLLGTHIPTMDGQAG